MPSLALQCASGASGDMLLGALLDLGASLERVRAGVAAVAPEPVEITVEPVRRAGFAALKAHVRVAESHHHRGWSHVRDLITAAGPELDDGARRRALETFRLLAQAEARAHGVGLDEVHFHEVGALDAIADVVGVCVALEDLGVDEVHADVVAVGSGQVRTSHGLLPVPVPAVLELFAGTDAVLEAGPVRAELCTPTGAALLVAQVGAWGAPPPATVVKVGVGAGSADHTRSANVVRAMLVEPVPQLAATPLPSPAVAR
ncbi:LarC family nickel insertion protein [Nocardioides nanhaiensis]|uniref:LarC family nickel insertion protein n=1 Tax=Nocardioides nanhaiensis TaxID=1476871 RepID=A0ABP8VWV1_9ACTN